MVMTLAAASQADLVDDFWLKVTDENGSNGANAAAIGEDIRVVFATSSKIVGTITSQGVYDMLATNSANKGTLTKELTVTGGWKALVTADDAVGSEPVNDWLDDYGDIKVFNTNGDYVGTALTLLSGLTNPIKYNESGVDLTGGSASTMVWTGTDDAGTAAFGPWTTGASSEGPLHLGNDTEQAGLGPFGMAGDMSSTSSSWIEDEPFPLSAANGQFAFPLSIYSMSGSIEAVPEPSTILLWLGFSGIAGLVYWRKRRS
jgi:hypothetical protein